VIFLRLSNALCLYCHVAARYDHRLVLEDLVSCVLDRGLAIDSAIRRDASYVLLSVDGRVVFRDVCALISPGMSLDGFLSSQGYPHSKLKFPFGAFESMDYLKRTEFPPRADFVSDMGGGEGISEEDYRRCLAVFDARCSTLWDYMDEYNRCDVDNFALAVLKVLDFWRGHGEGRRLSRSFQMT